MLAETVCLTIAALTLCNDNKIPVKILTKRTEFISLLIEDVSRFDKSIIAIGFTLTEHDELEPNASTNISRVVAIRKCKEAGYKTFASIEPIIEFYDSEKMIEFTLPYCDLYKIGLEKSMVYHSVRAETFVERLDKLKKPKIYMKESLQKLTGIKNSDLDEYFVEKDFNMFK